MLTIRTALAAIEPLFLQINPKIPRQQRVGFICRSAVRTVKTHKPLRQHTCDGRCYEKRLDVHINQAGKNTRCCSTVNGTDNKVACQPGLDCHFCRLQIAYFANDDYFRVLPQDGAQCLRKSELHMVIYLNLGNAIHGIFDRVFNGDHIDGVVLHLHHFMECCIDGGGFTARTWTCQQQSPLGSCYKGAYAVRNSFRKTEHVQMVQVFGCAQYAHHDFFPVDGGDGGYAHGTSAGTLLPVNTSVLGHIFPVNNQVGKHFDPGNNLGLKFARNHCNLLQDAIKAITQGQIIAPRLQMYVAAPVVYCLTEHNIHGIGNTSIVSAFHAVQHGSLYVNKRNNLYTAPNFNSLDFCHVISFQKRLLHEDHHHGALKMPKSTNIFNREKNQGMQPVCIKKKCYSARTKCQLHF